LSTQINTLTYSPQPIRCQYAMTLDVPGLKIFIHSLFGKLHPLPPTTVTLHGLSPSVLRHQFQLKTVRLLQLRSWKFLGWL